MDSSVYQGADFTLPFMLLHPQYEAIPNYRIPILIPSRNLCSVCEILEWVTGIIGGSPGFYRKFYVHCPKVYWIGLEMIKCTEVGTRAISYGVIFTGLYHQIRIQHLRQCSRASQSQNQTESCLAQTGHTPRYIERHDQ